MSSSRSLSAADGARAYFMRLARKDRFDRNACGASEKNSNAERPVKAANQALDGNAHDFSENVTAAVGASNVADRGIDPLLFFEGWVKCGAFLALGTCVFLALWGWMD
jgi:hypothetical protein